MKRLLATLLCLAALAVPALAAPRHVIVIAMENKDGEQVNDGRNYIYGNSAADYINNTLAPLAARADNFVDERQGAPSQPHYILMEAGRTKFHDTTFTCDSDPDESCGGGRQNWAGTHEHLTAQLEDAKPAFTWMTYQEGISPENTGRCPIHSSGLYAAKHNPFVYFGEISGTPPDENNAYCIAHTRDLQDFAKDMAEGTLANYVFISPNLCNDMHGAGKCRGNPVRKGDRFLKSFLPPVLDWAEKNDAVVFLMWDESAEGTKIPFYALGPGIKAGHVSTERYSHRSVLRTVERIFGLPPLNAVKDANDLSDLFEPGVLP